MGVEVGFAHSKGFLNPFWFNCWIKGWEERNKTAVILIILFLTFKILIMLVYAAVTRVPRAPSDLNDIVLSSSPPLCHDPCKSRTMSKVFVNFLGLRNWEDLYSHGLLCHPVSCSFGHDLSFHHIDQGMKARAFLSSLRVEFTKGGESCVGGHITHSSQTSSTSLAPLSLCPSSPYPFPPGFLKLL